MKKSMFILVVSLFFFSAPSFAQIFVGPKIGTGISTYRLSSLLGEDWDAKPRFSNAFGVALEFPIAAGFSVQGETYLVKKGSKLEREILSPNFALTLVDENGFPIGELPLYADFTENLNYLEIPVFAKYEIPGDMVGFHVMAGPVLSLGLGGKYQISLKDEDGNSRLNAESDTYNMIFEDNGGDLEEDIEFGSSTSDLYKATDFGLGFGAGVYIEAGPGRINADLRLVMGLSNMIDTTDPDISQSNNLVQFSLSYLIAIGG